MYFLGIIYEPHFIAFFEPGALFADKKTPNKYFSLRHFPYTSNTYLYFTFWAQIADTDLIGIQFCFISSIRIFLKTNFSDTKVAAMARFTP